MADPLDLSLQLLQKLSNQAWARPSAADGCIRQNQLSEQQPVSGWRYLRGNAILAILGEKVDVYAPFGPFQVYRTSFEGRWWLLQFRGGETKPWWNSDCVRQVGILMALTDLPWAGCALVQELDNRIRITSIPAPTVDLAREFLREAVQQWQTLGRIPKDSPKAMVAMCPYCPVKAQCEAMDLERGETSDWTPRSSPGSSTLLVASLP